MGTFSIVGTDTTNRWYIVGSGHSVEMAQSLCMIAIQDFHCIDFCVVSDERAREIDGKFWPEVQALPAERSNRHRRAIYTALESSLFRSGDEEVAYILWAHAWTWGEASLSECPRLDLVRPGLAES